MLAETKNGMVLLPEPATANPITQIKIEHQGCYGTCPIYTVTLSSDGTATYQGKQYTSRLGLYKSTFALWNWYRLKTAFIRDQFDKMPPYVGLTPDASRATLTVKHRDGTSKSVQFSNVNASQPLWELSILTESPTEGATWKPTFPLTNSNIVRHPTQPLTPPPSSLLQAPPSFERGTSGREGGRGVR